MLTIAAVYISPMICGSPNEKKMMSTPTELETSGSGDVAVVLVDKVWR
jgi:hypothetical protein